MSRQLEHPSKNQHNPSKVINRWYWELVRMVDFIRIKSESDSRGKSDSRGNRDFN